MTVEQANMQPVENNTGVTENEKTETAKAFLIDALDPSTIDLDGLDNALELEDFLSSGDPKEAKGILAKENSHLNSKEDSAKITALQEGLVDGDFKKFGDTLKGMRPEERSKFAKELNRQLKEHSAGVNLTEGKDGSLILHKNDGGTAIQFNKDGTTTLKTMEKNIDGGLNLSPGEVINQKPEEAMKSIGETAVNNLTALKLPDCIIEEPKDIIPLIKEPIDNDDLLISPEDYGGFDQLKKALEDYIDK